MLNKTSVLDEILNLIESVSEGLPTFSFKYTYCLRNGTAYQCVVSDQPLHRWIVVSSACSTVRLKFQLRGIVIF